jgi:hypothetical protein
VIAVCCAGGSFGFVSGVLRFVARRVGVSVGNFVAFLDVDIIVGFDFVEVDAVGIGATVGADAVGVVDFVGVANLLDENSSFVGMVWWVFVEMVGINAVGIAC